MGRRGQITVFVILGIVLLVIAAGAFFLLKPRTEKIVDTSGDYDKIFYLAQSCVELSAKQAVWTATNKGFYDESNYNVDEIITYNESFYDPLNLSHIYMLEQTRPIYLNKGKAKMPSTSEAEQVISIKFNEYFQDCMMSSNISMQFENITIGKAKSSVEMNEENILFKTEADITFTNNGATSYINELSYSLNYPLLNKYEQAKKYIETQSEEPDFMIGYLTFLSKTNNFQYSIISTNTSTIVYEFIFDDYEEIIDEKLILGFAVNYEW